MPDYQYLNGAYQNMLAMQGVGGSLANLAAVRRSLPYMYQQQSLADQRLGLEAAQLAQQGALNRAHMGLYEAQRKEAEESALAEAMKRQTAQEQLRLSASLGQAAADYFPQFEGAPTVRGMETLRDRQFASSLASLAAMNPANVVRQALELKLASSNPEMAQYIATGSPLPSTTERALILGPQQQAYSPQGTFLAENPNVRPPSRGMTAEDRYAEDVNRLINAVYSGAARNIFPGEKFAMSSYTPLLQGTNLLLKAQAPMGVPAAAATPIPLTPGVTNVAPQTIRVLRSDGKYGRVPVDQLAEALKEKDAQGNPLYTVPQ